MIFWDFGDLFYFLYIPFFLKTQVAKRSGNPGIVLKADISDVYNENVVYTKTETDGLLNNKANSSDIYIQNRIK